MAIPDGPLLVFGPASLGYDFGDHHPLTPRRFGPGIDLLRAVGAVPTLAPEPASDAELELVHTARYVDTVRRFGDDPWMPGTMGIGLSDNPAFEGMHEAAAAVAGGSLRAIDAILAGRVRHAYHPGGGLHHAMPERAWGFCIYDDVGLAIARVRAAGLRVLYVDLDVHHGVGVQAMHLGDPGVLTLSFHESGRYLFPETGFLDELGSGRAAGTSVNVPFEPYSGEGVWLPAVRSLVGELASVFAPDVVVSQHGADAHAWDPLAHLRVTTTAQAEAARIIDAVAHRWAGGRWLATGGGGYDVYRVVPRTWALTWLAGAHREPPAELPAAFRARWTADAESWSQAPIPTTFVDEPNAGLAVSSTQTDSERRSAAMVALVRRVVVPRLVREAVDRGWWSASAGLAWAPTGEPSNPLAAVVAGGASASTPSSAPAAPASAGSPSSAAGSGGTATPAITGLDRALLDRLSIAPRVLAPADPADLRAILAAALSEPATVVTAAVAGDVIVGLAVAAAATDASGSDAPARSLLGIGVEPGHRGRGVGAALLRSLVEAHDANGGGGFEALIGVAERDPVEPEEASTRSDVARRLLEGAGFRILQPPPEILSADRWVVAGRRG